MAHNHSHHEKAGNIKAAFILNFSFTIVEIIGGIITNSMAILSDALHDLGDSLSLGIAWYLHKYSEKQPDEKFSFGYARFSLLGALLNSIILIIGSSIILTRAVPRILNPEPVNPKGMIFFAVLGILVNGAAALKLKKGQSLNERVVSWHLIEDVLGWIAILIVSTILVFVNIPVLDPILSLLITLYVVYNVVLNLKEILRVFLEGVPKHLSIEEIEKELFDKCNIKKVFHTHIWSLEGEKNMLSTHIVVSDDTDREEIIYIKKLIRDLMHKRGINHVTIEVNFESEEWKSQICEDTL